MKINETLEFRSADVVTSNKNGRVFYLLRFENTAHKPVEILAEKEDFDKKYKIAFGKKYQVSASNNSALFLNSLGVING